MPVKAQSADGVVHEFPDGTAPDVVDKAMKSYSTQAPPSGRLDVFKGEPPPAAKKGKGYLEKALEPLTSYPGTYEEMNKAGRDKMSQGATELGTKGSRMKGAFDVGAGALEYLSSPVTAGLRTVAGKPVEENFGIPKELTEFAIGLGIPGYGLPSVRQQAIGAVKNASGLLEKIVSPETVDASAKSAAASIRSFGGTAARDTAITETKLEPAWKKISAMPDTDRLNFIDYVEGRSGQYAGLSMRDPELQQLADTLKTEFGKRMSKIQALPSHQQQAFIDDYFPHFWKDPNAAQQAAQAGGGMSRQGSGASLKARTVPTIADGVAMGLEPITTNPLEATLRYVTSMDRFIASVEVLETAKNAGQVRYVKPQVMGASGHPNSFKAPPGWKPLTGRGSRDATGGQAYAPEGFARVYNNYIDRGIHENEELGKVYDVARMTSNAITGLELSLSGYHFLTVGKAALDNSMANAINLMRSGKPVAAVVQAIKTPTAPLRYARSGKEVKDVYLGLSQGSRQLQDTVELLEKAGGRAKGKGHAPEYEFSKGGSYVTAYKRGALKIQMIADRAEAMGSPIGFAKVGARHFGRIMDTIAAPLFEQYIPAVKNGAFRENLGVWLQKHPNASPDEQVSAARQIWDSIDDRFGEMVQDNMFMDKTIKQIGMLSLRSFSWTVGQDVRMLGGAARDVARAPFKTAAGIGPNDTRWTQKMDMAIAMPIVYGTGAAIYQYLKTGKAPEDINDLVAPRTGGTDASTGEPERLMLPGPEKDVAGVAMHGLHEFDNKTSKAVSEMWHLWNNKDWRGDPVFSGAEDAPPWLQQVWDYASNNYLPISMQNLAKGKKEGSNLNRFEQMMGVRTAPAYMTSKEAYDDMMERMRAGDYKKKSRHDERQRGLYEE